MSRDQPDDYSELSDRLASYYEGRKPTGGESLSCNCRTGEHHTFFIVEGKDADEVLQTIPGGFSRDQSRFLSMDLNPYYALSLVKLNA